MDVVERAELNPAKCVITGDIDGPFIDTGRDLIDPENGSLRFRVYLHVPLVKEYARELGMIDREKIEELQEDVANLRCEYDKLYDIAEASEKVVELVQPLEPVAA